MKKALICLSIIILLLSLTTSFWCVAEDYQAQVDDFNALLVSLDELYQKHVNENTDLVTTEYFGLINNGEQILANSGIATLISDDSKQSFYQYRHYYFVEKLKTQVEQSVDSAAYSVSFGDKIVYFYPEQWQAVENVYAEMITKIEGLSVGVDFDAVWGEYKVRISELDNREKADEARSTNALKAIEKMDKFIVTKVNERMAGAINESEIEKYYIFADKTLYNEWFKGVVGIGYSQSNALDLTIIHQSAIDKIEGLSVFAGFDEYDKIINDAITEIDKIAVNNNSGGGALLEAAKESAYLILDSFLTSESYESASQAVRRKFDKIINEAKSDIEGAESIKEVDSIRISAQETLANVDTSSGSWETPLAVGIVLLVISIAFIVVYVIAKKRQDKYTAYKAELHKQRLLLDRQIDLKLKEKENENDDA